MNGQLAFRVRARALPAAALAPPARPPAPLLLRGRPRLVRGLGVHQLLRGLLRLLYLLLDLGSALAEEGLEERGVARVGLVDGEHDVAEEWDEADRRGDEVVGKHLVVYMFGYTENMCVSRKPWE